MGVVAGIRKSQLTELHEVGTTRLEDFALATKPHPSRPKRGSLESLSKVHRQAKIQYKGRKSGKPEFEFEEFQKDRGFCLLPQPNPGDIFFDIEGNPRAGSNGLEYLLGYAEAGGDRAQYTALWAYTKAQEKANFETLMRYLFERIKQYPEMFIYHYAPYEPSALKRLSLEHAIFEDELDEILRSERFVDLYAVVRQSIRASVESYSIKQMEVFYGFNRTEPLEKARISLGIVERLLEIGITEQLGLEHRNSVQRYNEDDCRSTYSLRNWLEQLRRQAETQYSAIPRRTVKPHEPNPQVIETITQTKRVFDDLMLGMGDEPKNDVERCRWLLAHMLEYFRREQKVVWWEFFRLRDLSSDELFSEQSALAGLEHVEQLPLIGRSKVPTHRYRFPAQEAFMRVGDDIWNTVGEKIGTLEALDLESRTIDIKKTGKTQHDRPTEVFAFKSINPGNLPKALLELGVTLQNGLARGEVPRSARFDLLMRCPPRLRSLRLPLAGEVSDVATRAALDLDDSYLAIQGPPGAGKTFVGSRMIQSLARAGYRVGVTAVSHKVILHLLQGVHQASDGAVQVAHQITEPSDNFPAEVLHSPDKQRSLEHLEDGFVVGGTAWLWSDPIMEGKLDYLFIDEAGQMSLAVALAAGRAARNIILLGDPQQLEQPQQGSHPHGSGVAALSHILGPKATIDAKEGIFLSDTWRLHPDICRFTSEQYYDDRLKSRSGLEKLKIVDSAGNEAFGLQFVPVHHSGNENCSLEEVEEVASRLEQFLSGGYRWINRDGISAPLTIADVLIVAPFNAQVNALKIRLPAGARVGTVDKFQGQEAPIVIYSMTSSTIEDAPRGITFLLNRNRMNVATSRAKCLAMVVGTESLIAPSASGPDAIRLANGLCRFIELGGAYTTLP